MVVIGLLNKRSRWCAALCLAVGVLALAGMSMAADAPASAPAVTSAPTTAPAAVDPYKDVNTGDNAWLLISSALVMFMTPGLAFFYGGLVRKKNVLSILMQCMILLCLISVQWVVFGYSLAFGPDHGGLIGDLSWVGLNNVTLVPNADYAATVPHQSFMIFQMMFAVITPGLIIGAFAERMRFGPFCVFSLLWATLVYDPVCHWVWGKGGIMGTMGGWGALDFAGGTVVHITAGVSALATALFLGRRKGYPEAISPPHNLPIAVLGAAMLWFGWFGFNAGSALGSGPLATSAFVVTHVAAAMGGLGWAMMDWIFGKHPTMLGVITGAVGGLVAITPASGFVNVFGALAIGLGVAVICWIFVMVLKPKFGYDDSLDAFGVHGIGGIWGALATGLFATKAIPNPVGQDGLFYGNPAQFWIQCKAVGVSAVYAFVATFILLKAVDMVCKLRPSEQDERIGLDLTQHRESGYTVID